MAAYRSLREDQIKALTAILTLNDNTTTASNSNVTTNTTTIPTWKVLIMDKLAQDILATSLRVQDLRDQGVTLHMLVVE
jgi:cellobiose phosphorylase